MEGVATKILGRTTLNLPFVTRPPPPYLHFFDDSR